MHAKIGRAREHAHIKASVRLAVDSLFCSIRRLPQGFPLLIRHAGDPQYIHTRGGVQQQPGRWLELLIDASKALLCFVLQRPSSCSLASATGLLLE